MKDLILIVCFSFILLSCKDSSPYPGFSKKNDGIYVKLHSFSGGKGNNQGDFFKIHYSLTTLTDSSLRSTREIFLSKNNNRSQSMLNNIFQLNEGDSVTYIADADSISFIGNLDSKGMIKVNLKVSEILSATEYTDHAKGINKTEQTAATEQETIYHYIEDNYSKVSPLENGTYYIPLREGNGTPAEMGKHVAIKYKGWFLNGVLFDSLTVNYPLEFTLGDQYQVIPGLEAGICLMKEGGHAKFIIPSHLAYGAQGSSTGLVPPFTAVIYEVELLKVKL